MLPTLKKVTIITIIIMKIIKMMMVIGVGNTN